MNVDALLLDQTRIERLAELLDGLGRITIAVSGGVDSMTLASFAHRRFGPNRVLAVHAVSPAVPAAATARVQEQAAAEGWRLQLADAGEVADPRYRANPVDRCYYCKTNLYDLLAGMPGDRVLSGANLDDLGDYRPGLKAAEEHGVRHPFIEAAFAKAHIRALARLLGLPELAALPASPCLASRVETGIAIAEEDLRLIDRLEAWLRQNLGAETLRCRLRHDGLVVELDEGALRGLGEDHRLRLIDGLRAHLPELRAADPIRIQPYRRGSAFVGKPETGQP